MKTLGQVLKESREKSNKKLREVEEIAGISNAYLSQLENNKIKKPSANVLYKLSQVYEVELDIFLTAAGIIDANKKPNNPVKSELQKKIAFMADKLSEEEEKEILNFIEYIRHKNKNA